MKVLFSFKRIHPSLFSRTALIIAVLFAVFTLSACNNETSGQERHKSSMPQSASSQETDKSGGYAEAPVFEETYIAEPNAPGESTVNADSTSSPQKPEAGSGTIWDKLGLIQDDPYNAYGSDLAFDEQVEPAGAPSLLTEGLSHSNPVVNWFSAYKILDFPDKIDTATVCKRLRALLTSEEDYVKEAAALTLAVLNKDWNSPLFSKSPKKNRYAFTRYQNCRGNDGNAFIVQDGQVKKQNLGFDIYVCGWSPDGNWLACGSPYRYGSSLRLLEIDTGKVVSLGDNVLDSLLPVLPRLALNPTRGFSDLKLLQWSPDSKKLLLSYKYSDIQLRDSWLLLVDAFRSNTVDWAASLTDEEQFNPEYVSQTTGVPGVPAGFKWNEPGYGLPGGFLNNLPSEDLLAGADAAMQDLLKAVSENNLAEFKLFADPSKKYTDAQVKAALEDFRTCFGNKPAVNSIYSGPGPETLNSFRYGVYNESRGGQYFTLNFNSLGTFTLSHPFMEYSARVHKLAEEYTQALKHEDIKALTRLLSLKKPATRESVQKMVDIYKVNIDIGNPHIVFAGAVDGNALKGKYYYEVKNADGNTLNGIHINYSGSKLTLLDSWLEQIQ